MLFYRYHYNKIRDLIASMLGFESLEGRLQLLREAGIPQKLINLIHLQAPAEIAADQILHLINGYGDEALAKQLLSTLGIRFGPLTSERAYLQSVIDIPQTIGIVTSPPQQWEHVFIEESTREGQDAAWPEKIIRQALAKARAVALVRVGTKIGTGVMIGSRFFLTCRHVLKDIEEAASAEFIFNSQSSKDGTEEAIEVFRRREEGIFYVSMTLDYAIVELAENSMGELPGIKWESAKLSDHIPDKGEPVILVQHSYGFYKRISFSKIAFTEAPSLGYLADTMPGSSGSPVFDRTLEIVGLHKGSSQQSVGGFPFRFSYNQGTLSRAIFYDIPEQLRNNM